MTATRPKTEREPTGAASMRANEPGPALPYAEVGSEPASIPFYRGTVQVVARSLDGGTEVIETITCECKWAHVSPEIAARCGRKLANARGLRIGAPAE